jgi:hypothetical protein
MRQQYVQQDGLLLHLVLLLKLLLVRHRLRGVLLKQQQRLLQLDVRKYLLLGYV